MKPSESIKFIIHPGVKKSDGKTLAVSDISEQMLFGNGITAGGVMIGNGTEGVPATILVVDSSYEEVINSIMNQLASLLSQP